MKTLNYFGQFANAQFGNSVLVTLILFVVTLSTVACSKGRSSSISPLISIGPSPVIDVTQSPTNTQTPAMQMPEIFPTVVVTTTPASTPTLVEKQTQIEEGVRISQLCNREHAPVGIIPGGIWLFEKSSQDGLWMTKRDVASAKRIVEAGDMDTLRLSPDYSNLVITNFNAKPRQFTVMSSDGENIQTFNWKNEWPLEPSPMGIISWYPNRFLKLSGNVDYETGYGDFYFISPYTGEVYKQISDELKYAHFNSDLTRMVRGGEVGLDLIDVDRHRIIKMNLGWVEPWLFRGAGFYWSQDGELFIYYDVPSANLFNIIVIDKDGNELFRSRFESEYKSFYIDILFAEMSPSHRYMAFWAVSSRFDDRPDPWLYNLYVYDFTNQYLYDFCILHDDPSYPQIIWSPDSHYLVGTDQQGINFYLDILSGDIRWFPKDIRLRGWAK